MPSGSDLQGSVEKTREAFRRISVDDADEFRPPAIPFRNEPPASEPGPRGEDVGQLHPFFQGLLDALPEPGTEWPVAKREQWLETARNIFALMYGDPEEAKPPLRFAHTSPATSYGEPRLAEQPA